MSEAETTQPELRIGPLRTLPGRGPFASGCVPTEATAPLAEGRILVKSMTGNTYNPRVLTAPGIREARPPPSLPSLETHSERRCRIGSYGASL
jgi:hypothetical protein